MCISSRHKRSNCDFLSLFPLFIVMICHQHIRLLADFEFEIYGDVVKCKICIEQKHNATLFTIEHITFKHIKYVEVCCSKNIQRWSCFSSCKLEIPLAMMHPYTRPQRCRLFKWALITTYSQIFMSWYGKP